MFRSFVSALAGRRSLIAGILVAGVLCTIQTGAQQQPAAPAAPPTQKFGPDGGMVLHFIKADKTADFEMVMGKLKEVLQKSSKPERKEQAKSWKLFKSVDPAAGGNVLYIFFIDPSVKDADYTVSTILAEGFPPLEVNALFEKFGASYAQGQNLVNLALVSDFGK